HSRMSAKGRKQTFAAQGHVSFTPQNRTSVSASAISISHPAPHPLNVVFISRSELTAHLGRLEGGVDPLSGGEDSDRALSVVHRYSRCPVHRELDRAADRHSSGDC